jgi:hypothetical protein
MDGAFDSPWHRRNNYPEQDKGEIKQVRSGRGEGKEWKIRISSSIPPTISSMRGDVAVCMLVASCSPPTMYIYCNKLKNLVCDLREWRERKGWRSNKHTCNRESTLPTLYFRL